MIKIEDKKTKENKYVVLPVRLAIGGNIFTKDQVVTTSDIGLGYVQNALNAKVIKLLDESVVISKKAVSESESLDLNKDGVVDGKDASIAAQVMNKVRHQKPDKKK